MSNLGGGGESHGYRCVGTCFNQTMYKLLYQNQKSDNSHQDNTHIRISKQDSWLTKTGCPFPSQSPFLFIAETLIEMLK